MMLKTLILTLILSISGMASAADDLRFFTERDMNQLAQKIGKNLHECKQLRKRPDVIVDVQNKTDDFVDKTKFSEFIHSQLEWKTHRLPDTAPPQFEIRARLLNEKKTSRGQTKSKYTIIAQVFQAEEKLCEKRASISKEFRSDPASENRTPKEKR